MLFIYNNVLHSALWIRQCLPAHLEEFGRRRQIGSMSEPLVDTPVEDLPALLISENGAELALLAQGSMPRTCYGPGEQNLYMNGIMIP